MGCCAVCFRSDAVIFATVVHTAGTANHFHSWLGIRCAVGERRDPGMTFVLVLLLLQDLFDGSHH